MDEEDFAPLLGAPFVRTDVAIGRGDVAGAGEGVVWVGVVVVGQGGLSLGARARGAVDFGGGWGVAYVGFDGFQEEETCYWGEEEVEEEGSFVWSEVGEEGGEVFHFRVKSGDVVAVFLLMSSSDS